MATPKTATPPVPADDAALTGEDTEQLETQLDKLDEEVADLDYKQAELKTELTDRVKYHDDQVVKLQQRIVFHQGQRGKVAGMLGKLGVSVNGAPVVKTTINDGEDDDEGGESGNGKPQKKGKAGGGGGGKGDNKYSAKEAVLLVLKKNVDAFNAEQLAQKVQMGEEVGGAGYKTTADADAFKTSLMNTAIRPLVKEGKIIEDKTVKPTIFIHLENVEAVLAKIAAGDDE